MIEPTFEVTDAEIEIDGVSAFSGADLSVVVEHVGNYHKEVYGELHIRHAIPSCIFLKEDGIPFSVDVTGDDGERRIELSEVLAVGDLNRNRLEFVAIDVDHTIYNPEPTTEERVIDVLSDLIEELQ